VVIVDAGVKDVPNVVPDGVTRLVVGVGTGAAALV
jgi:hypothetical protein